MRRLLAMLLALAFIAVPTSSLGSPNVYKNCAALTKQYPNGVAQTAKFKNLGNGPIASPKVDAKVYLANKKLDVDKDGIACEKVKTASGNSAQPNPNSPADAGFASIDKNSWKVAQAAVLSAVAAGNNTVAISYQVGPALPQARLETRKAALENAAKLWSKWFSPISVEAIYWSENDAVWAEDKLLKSWNYRTNLQQIANGEKGNCGSAGANGDPRVVSFHECVGSNLENVPSSVQTTPHEYTHLFQNQYGGCARYDWYCEGGAAYFGSTIGNTNDGDGSKRLAQLRTWSGTLGANRALVASGDKATVVRLLTEWQGGSHTRDAIAGSYFLGNLATEVLVAAKGVETWANFTIAMANESDFEANFKKHYGIDLATFYQIVADYVVSQPEIFY
jgi:hypothetical protein